MDQVSETRLALVMPEFAVKVRAMSTALGYQGLYIRVIQGLRTIAEENALWAQGRTTPGPIVTNAQGGYSQHNFGLAVDCAPSKNAIGEPFDPDWDGKDAHYSAMIATGMAQGLISGAFWHSIHDFPHFQMPHCPVTPDDKMRADIAAGGLPMVWSIYNAGGYGELSV